MAVAQATVRAAGLPPREAIGFFAGKLNTTTQHWTDVWRTGHSHAFMVAGAATEDLVTDFRAEVAKALEQGTTLADFRKGFDSIVAKHGWVHNGTAAWRARIIYETNLSTAYAAGRYAQQTEPDTLAVYPYWQYVHSGSVHFRLQHKAWDGLVLRADDPFWTTHYPPNGWRCGCRTRGVSARRLARQGKTGPDQAPPIVTRPWTNPRTGVTSQVPEGIDPGFDYNPGQAWQGGGLPAIPADAEWTPPPGWMPAPPRLPARTARPASSPVGPVEDAVPVGAPGATAKPDLPLPREQLEEERARLLDRLRRLQGAAGAQVGAALDLPALRLLADAAAAERTALLDKLAGLRGYRARRAAEGDSLETLRRRVAEAERAR